MTMLSEFKFAVINLILHFSVDRTITNSSHFSNGNGKKIKISQYDVVLS